ncbi:SURF1 family protein [Demequina aurantiaca]|uniref:SURF1 family protein n=1 Tax=Demequina aurantiaca TaxID=676200 RepID=UPI003D345E55
MTSSPAREYAPWVRITGIILTALAVCAVAAMLGRWQYHRFEVRADALEQYELGQQEAPKPIAELIPAGATDLPPHTQWREVVLVGHFDPESTTVLRNRPVDSIPTWQYLAWFDTTDGRSMLVNLGWIPLPATGTTTAPVPYPTAETTITVITRSWEDDDGKRGDGATRVIPEQVPVPVNESVPGYGMLREVCAEDACASVVVGEQTPLPSLSTGPHLSYAWQWWVLAAMAPVGAVVLIRRDRADDQDAEAGADAGLSEQASETPAESGAAGGEPSIGRATARPSRASAPRKGRRARLSDEEIEDAL